MTNFDDADIDFFEARQKYEPEPENKHDLRTAIILVAFIIMLLLACWGWGTVIYGLVCGCP